MEKKTPVTKASERKGLQQVQYPQNRTETSKGCGTSMGMGCPASTEADLELERLERVAHQDHPGLCSLMEAQHPTLIYRALEDQTHQCGSCIFAEPRKGSLALGDMECRMNPPGSGGNYTQISKTTPMCSNHEIDPGWSTSAFAMLLKLNNEQSKALHMLDIHRIEAIHKWEDVTGRKWPKDKVRDEAVEDKAVEDKTDMPIDPAEAAIAAFMFPWEAPKGILKFKGQAPDPEKLDAFKEELDKLMVPASSVKELWDRSEMQYWSEQGGQWVKEAPKESAMAKGGSGDAPMPKDEPVPEANPYKAAPMPIRKGSVDGEAIATEAKYVCESEVGRWLAGDISEVDIHRASVAMLVDVYAIGHRLQRSDPNAHSVLADVLRAIEEELPLRCQTLDLSIPPRSIGQSTIAQVNSDLSQIDAALCVSFIQSNHIGRNHHAEDSIDRLRKYSSDLLKRKQLLLGQLAILEKEDLEESINTETLPAVPSVKHYPGESGAPAMEALASEESNESEAQALETLYEKKPFLKVRTGELPVATYTIHGGNIYFYADSKPSEPAIEVIDKGDVSLVEALRLSLEVWQRAVSEIRFVADRLPVLEYHSGRYAFAYDTMASENPWTCKINDGPWVELSTMNHDLPIVLKEFHRQILRQFRARIEEAASVFEARDNNTKS